MVIYCKRPDQILWILWGDIHDLPQILHYPGNISIWLLIFVSFTLFAHVSVRIVLSQLHTVDAYLFLMVFSRTLTLTEMFHWIYQPRSRYFQLMLLSWGLSISVVTWFWRTCILNGWELGANDVTAHSIHQWYNFPSCLYIRYLMWDQ